MDNNRDKRLSASIELGVENMCHPFHQIIAQSPASASWELEVSDDPRVPVTHNRRGWLGSLIAGGAAALALFKAGGAQAAQVGSSVTAPGKVTTQALGEEGGGSYPPPYSGPVTTQALGEEGAGYPPPSGPVTTQALGEEGGSFPRYPSYRYRRRRPTTFALGEEGTRYYRPPYSYPPPNPRPPGTVTTFALGEEGASYR